MQLFKSELYANSYKLGDFYIRSLTFGTGFIGREGGTRNLAEICDNFPGNTLSQQRVPRACLMTCAQPMHETLAPKAKTLRPGFK